jgi:hypothetical protein
MNELELHLELYLINAEKVGLQAHPENLETVFSFFYRYKIRNSFLVFVLI